MLTSSLISAVLTPEKTDLWCAAYLPTKSHRAFFIHAIYSLVEEFKREPMYAPRFYVFAVSGCEEDFVRNTLQPLACVGAIVWYIYMETRQTQFAGLRSILDTYNDNIPTRVLFMDADDFVMPNRTKFLCGWHDKLQGSVYASATDWTRTSITSMKEVKKVVDSAVEFGGLVPFIDGVWLPRAPYVAGEDTPNSIHTFSDLQEYLLTADLNDNYADTGLYISQIEKGRAFYVFTNQPIYLHRRWEGSVTANS